MDKKPDNQAEAQKEEYKTFTFMKALTLSMEFGFIIVLPLLAFVYLGKYLDSKYNQHIFVVFGIVLALVTSSIWFYVSIEKIIKRLKK